MIEYLTHQEIQIELDSSQYQDKIPAYANRKYPIEYLNSREFEMLLYFLYQKEINSGQFRDKYDSILLMKGTAERGRDIILQKDGKNTAIIQCKRYVDLINKPQLIREILKFVLHYLQDQSLIYDPTFFTYYFVALKGFNDPTLELIQDFNNNILKEDKLKNYTERVLEDNESISFKTFEEIEKPLKDILSKIKIVPINGIDIDIKLKTSKEIISVFFEVEKVASQEMLDEIFKKYVGFKNDEDLDRLRKRLQDLPKEYRMSLGLFSIFGYDENFYRIIAHDKDLIVQIADLKSNFNSKFIAYLMDTIQKYHLIFISGLPDISPFTKQAIVPYLFNKYALKFQEAEIGEIFSSAIREKSEEQLIYKLRTLEDIKQHFLETGQKVLNNDFSTFVGDGELLKLKKELAYWTHKEFSSVQEMSERFDQDLQQLKPILEHIEILIKKIMPQNPTIIIENPNILDSEEAIDRLVENANRFDKK